MAQAIKRLYPDTKLAIGPSIADGFYYDVDRETPLTSEDLEKIEAEMKKIVKEDLKLERFELPRAEAIAFMKEKEEPYKVELIEDLPEDAVISFYRQGEFTDLCAGPHLMSTKPVKAFKLTSLAGAYWRGSEKNKMLQRIYGTAFTKKAELEEYLHMIEEAKKRDHRKLGKELGLFMMSEDGPGFPFFLPKGMDLKNALMDYWREIHRKAGYVEISTPIILNRRLWETSGHWDHYKENMYTTVIDAPSGVHIRKCWNYSRRAKDRLSSARKRWAISVESRIFTASFTSLPCWKCRKKQKKKLLCRQQDKNRRKNKFSAHAGLDNHALGDII